MTSRPRFGGLSVGSGVSLGVQANECRSASTVDEPLRRGSALLAATNFRDDLTVIRRVARDDLADVTATDRDAVTDRDGRRSVHSRDRIAAPGVVEEDEPGSDRAGQHGTEEGHGGENAAGPSWFVGVRRRLVHWRAGVAVCSELGERLVVPAPAIGLGEHLPRFVEARHRPIVLGPLRRCSESTEVGVELPRSTPIGRPEFSVGSVWNDAKSVVGRHQARPVMRRRVSTQIVRTPDRPGSPRGSGRGHVPADAGVAVPPAG